MENIIYASMPMTAPPNIAVVRCTLLSAFMIARSAGQQAAPAPKPEPQLRLMSVSPENIAVAWVIKASLA